MFRSLLLCMSAAVLLQPPTALSAEPSWPALEVGKKVAVVDKPTHITHAGDGSGMLYIVEQKGRIVALRNGKQLPEPFLDIRDRVGCCGERGLLSVAFPPGYAGKRHFYVNYTDGSGNTVVARFRASREGARADGDSETILLTVKQPFSNHNGGQMAFGPDGFLYIGLGDGGAANDPFGNGQKTSTLLGKILRIDVEADAVPYGIPPSNPFIRDRNARPEIWALGLRNPWRFSFDRGTGDLYIADVGQNKYEEVNV